MFTISTVLPLMVVMMSPGLYALPLGRLSVDGMTPVMRTGSSRLAAASMVPMTAAAPHMSNFISSIFSAGLMEMPPESKVMPLPTSATCFVALRGEYSSTMKRGSSADPRLTASRPPIFIFSMSRLS